MFYQYNPKSCSPGPMHWGHAVSEDMLHWRDLPIALYPEEESCFSGSAIAQDGKLYLFYTSCAMKGNRMVQTQSAAVSKDGVHFEKYAKNPIIKSPTEPVLPDFRDPKVIREKDFWYMVIGGSIGGCQSGDGCIFLYRSKDLLNWEYLGKLLESKGKLGTMFECPDLFYLDGHWVLTCSPIRHPDGAQAIYLVGDVDFTACTFHITKIGRLDDGFDYYAPQSFLDEHGNRVLFAWANGWDWMPWFSGFGPTEKEGWRGAMSFPRIARLDEDLNLLLTPVKQISTLAEKAQSFRNLRVGTEKIQLYPADPHSFLIHLRLDFTKQASSRLAIGFFSDKERELRILIDRMERKLCLERDHADGYGNGVKTADLPPDKEKLDLLILADHCLVEVFLDQGIRCMTTTVYPQAKQRGVWIKACKKETEIEILELMKMHSVWEDAKSP